MHHSTDRITHTTAFVTPVVEHWLEREIAQWVHPIKDRSDALPLSYVPLPQKIENLFASSMYICFSYIPHENNVYYNVYDTAIIKCISNDIGHFSEKGTVIIAGDLNSRVGNLLDYIEHDSIAEPLLDVLSHVLTYDDDVIFPKRVTEDTIVNSFGRTLINLCKNTGMRICNGRVASNESGCFAFYLGSRLCSCTQRQQLQYF